MGQKMVHLLLVIMLKMRCQNKLRNLFSQNKRFTSSMYTQFILFTFFLKNLK